jgi:hypothetical protein
MNAPITKPSPLPVPVAFKGKTIKPGMPFALVRACDMTFADPEFVIAGLVETESLAAIFGKPGSGKSFIALGMAASVASGTPYHGRDVMQGPVVYVAGEGHNGLRRRLAAWERHHGVSLADAPLHFSRRATSLLDPAAADAVIAAIESVAQAEGKPPRLIIVDTVARNFGAGDENSTRDMSLFVAGVDSIKGRFPGCSVLLVHHTGHGEGDRARGSSVLLGALDAEFRTELVDGITTLQGTKSKEGAIPPPIGFQGHSIEIGRTAKGEAVTSLAFEEVAAPDKGQPRMTAAHSLALDSFHRAKRAAGLADDVAAGVDQETWRAEFYSSSTAENQEAKKVAFQRARKTLVAGGWLAVTDGVYRLARLSEARP